MHRRRVLASLAAGTALPLAGCSSPLATRLRPEVDGEGDGETHVRFYRGDSEAATVTYLLGRPSDGRARFRVSLAHDLEAVRSFRLRLKPRTPAGDVPPRVLLERPGGHPWPTYRFQQGEGYGWTLFDVPDLGAQAPGTFTVTFWFDGVEADALDVATDLRAELDAGLDPRTVVAEAFTTAEGPDRAR